MISLFTLALIAAVARSCAGQTDIDFPINVTAIAQLPAPCQRLFARAPNTTLASHVEATACFAQVPLPRIVENAKRLATTALDFAAFTPWLEARANLAPGSIAARVANVTAASVANYTQAETAIDVALNPGWDPRGGPSNPPILFTTSVTAPFQLAWLQPLALFAEPTAADGKRGRVFVAGSAYDFHAREVALSPISGLGPDGKSRFNAFFAEKVPSVDLSSLVGNVVEQINGQDPWAWADEQNAANAGFSVSNYFGEFFFRNTTFEANGGRFSTCVAGNPRCASAVSYSFRNPQTGAVTNATFPWAVFTRNQDYILLQELMSVYGIPGESLLPAGPAVRRRDAAGRDLRRRQVGSPTTSSAVAALPDTLKTSVPAGTAARQNVVLVNPTTLAVILTNPINAGGFDFFSINATGSAGSAVRQRRFDSYTAYFKRMDEAIEAFAAENPGITDLILDVTQWNLDQEYVALLEYFFGATSPMQYSFRITPSIELALRLYTTSEVEAFIISSFFNTTRHLSPDNLAPVDILASRVSVTPTNATAPVSLSSRFVFADQVAARSLLTRTVLPAARKAFFDTTRITIVTRPERCDTTCAEFVRLASRQFGPRIVTYGSNAAVELGAISLPIPTFEDTATLLNGVALVNGTRPASSDILSGVSIGLSAVAAFDPTPLIEGSDIPLGVARLTPTADLTLKLAGNDWPLRVWTNAVSPAAELVVGGATAVTSASVPLKPKATGSRTTTASATLTATTVSTSTKSAGVKTVGSLMAAVVAVAAVMGIMA
ncbi:hypothetical protein HDU96_001358 [Phlyctochytrium bullatum]|nr:hypothetical protein HDU96_001358 [Phlyctochytrium bullatum]